MTTAYQLQARLLKALAHPSRLQLVGELAAGAKCVTELQASVGDHISTVSRHLAVLRDAGIVDARKSGLQVIYSLRTPCVHSFLNCLQSATDVRQDLIPVRSIAPCQNSQTV